ncbi:DMT family transporter [Metabacillus sp. GX 13764]|uniref:DMT family transporter n=1 Tax=Metabacillus kandeliae TaxID=2900151 RepID=UPI001E617A61|nr:DMT family transporter [Metabacillus kandeliae]MCD7033552.1 DMT family transporter [Metabacillus kandeliae]
MNFSKKSISYLCALISVVFWGMSFVSTKAVMMDLSPLEATGFRFGIAAVFLFLLIFTTGSRLRIKIIHLPIYLALSSIGITIHQLIQASSLLTIDASDAGWLVSLSPIFTAVISYLFLKEQLSFSKMIGIFIAVCGVLCLTVQKRAGFQMEIGFLLMILSTLNWAVYSILLKKFKLPYSVLTSTFYITLFGFLFTLPLLIKASTLEHFEQMTLESLLHLLFLGIFVSAAAYYCWGKALESLTAIEVSVFLYLEPAATVAAAFILLGEHPHPKSAIGGLFILLGVVLVNGHSLFFSEGAPNRKK